MANYPVIFSKPRRPVREVFIHCSAYANQDIIGNAFRDAVYNWHVNGNGWTDIGYHGLIDCKGNFMLGRDYEQVPAAQGGHNSLTLAFCLDGLRKDQFNEAQFETLRRLADKIDIAYGDSITYHGHCEVSSKLCPVFDYVEVLELDEKGYRRGKNHSMQVKKVADPEMPETAGKRTLSMTDMGQDVKTVQKIVGAEVDGIFGRETFEKVKAFQCSIGIADDGIVGPVTWEFLLKQ